MAILIVCGVDENGHRDIIAVEPMVEESRSSYGVLFQNLKEPRSVYAQAYHFRCSLRAGFGNSWVLSRRLMAALQGAFHAEYSCLCAAEREESLCRGAKGNLAGAHG